MKKFLTSILSLLFVLTLSAQSNTTVNADDPVVKKFTQTYDLNDAQVLKMITIQERRLRNLTEINNLRETDEKTYHQKRSAINKGTEISIGMILNTEQRTAFNATRVTIRQQKAIKSAELKEKGLTNEEIQIALIDLEDAMY